MTPHTKKQPRTLLSFTAVITGLVFLLNAPVNLVDLLPDAVGYLFLYFGVRRMADYFPYFDELAHGFHKLFWLSLAKLPVFFLFLLIYGGNTSERSLITVLALGYFVVELIFVLPIFRNLFRSFSYLGERYGIGSAEGARRGDADGLANFTSLFLVLRGVLSFLPELLFLPVRDALESVVAAVDFQQYYVVAVVLAQIAGFVLGIAWFCRMQRYIRLMKGDGALSALLSETAASTPSDVRRAVDSYRRIVVAFVCIAVGIGLHLNPVFDGINVFPNLVGALLFSVGVWFMLPFVKRRTGYFAGIASLIYAVFATVAYSLETTFLRTYDPGVLGKSMKADELYARCEIFAAISAVFGAVAILAVFYAIYEMLRRAADLGDGISCSGKRGEALSRLFHNRLIFSSILGVLTVATTALNVYLRHFTVRVPANEDMLGESMVVTQEFGWFWMIPMALAILWLGVFVSQLTAILSELKSIYNIEDDV